MSEDPFIFQNYVETPAETARLLNLYDDEARAIVEDWMKQHPGMSAREAINATLNFGGTVWFPDRKRRK